MSSSTDDTLVNKKCVPCHGGGGEIQTKEAEKKVGMGGSG